MSVIRKINPFAAKGQTYGTMPADAVDESIEAAKRYSKSRLSFAESRARMWMLVGASGWLAFVVCLLALLMVLPLIGRTVDHWWAPDAAGVFRQLPSFEEAVKKSPDAFNVYFAEKYVCARESWYADQADDLRAIVSWSTGHDDLQDYLKETDPKNPDAPIIAYGTKGQIDCNVVYDDTHLDKASGRYVSSMTFKKRFKMYSPPQVRIENWQVEFTWEKRPEDVPSTARKHNPLGMIVIHYHAQKV
jgi:type IV secretory pathway component VirB8